jgi:hypothetical protein
MKTLAVIALLLAQSLAAQAANIAIKNNTGVPQRLVIYQDGRLAGYVDRLKHGKTLLVKVSDTGSKPIVVLYRGGDQRFVFLPAKTRAYKLSWLLDLAW